jgi:hypothetical protein
MSSNVIVFEACEDLLSLALGLPELNDGGSSISDYLVVFGLTFLSQGADMSQT